MTRALSTRTGRRYPPGARLEADSHRTGDVRVIAAVGREVVLTDAIFTASAVVLQPATGFVMVALAGFSLSMPWLRLSIALYLLMGCCWLPVVWLKVPMRDMALRRG
jgi:uncharacterized membrane protein